LGPSSSNITAFYSVPYNATVDVAKLWVETLPRYDGDTNYPSSVRFAEFLIPPFYLSLCFIAFVDCFWFDNVGASTYTGDGGIHGISNLFDNS
jgi:hypothetical protein